MSSRNGDKARFQKNRKRKLAKRRRLQALVAQARADVVPTEKSAPKA